MNCEVGNNMNKPHAVCIPFPAQSHINAMLSVAKLVHQKGFHITFVNTEYNHKRIINSRGPNALDNILDFRFKTIPDGMPVTSDDDIDAPQDLTALCIAISENFSAPFSSVVGEVNLCNDTPRVSCIISDGFLSFTIQTAAEFNIPVLHFFPFSACSVLAFLHLNQLQKRGINLFKDERSSRKEYLEMKIDWIPGMKNIRLKDLPNFPQKIDPNDRIGKFAIQEITKSKKANAIILNTFNALEEEALEALSHILPPIYTIGPVHLLTNNQTLLLQSIATNLWKENPNCLTWLNSHPQSSVLYVNFGSITVMTPQNLVEFAWGLANCGKPFLWIIRPDLVQPQPQPQPHHDDDHDDDSIISILPIGFFEQIEGRGMVASWCAQKEVLKHPSIAAFLTHCGWNSILESVAAGVPMILWPFFADQPTNCRYCCAEWGVGFEIRGGDDVEREEVERCVREVMEGQMGKDMKRNVMELKCLAHESCELGGSSYCNFDKLILQILGNDSFEVSQQHSNNEVEAS